MSNVSRPTIDTEPFIPPSQIATAVYDKGSGILPRPLKGVDRLDTSVKRVQRLNDIADEVAIRHLARTERNVHPIGKLPHYITQKRMSAEI